MLAISPSSISFTSFFQKYGSRDTNMKLYVNFHCKPSYFKPDYFGITAQKNSQNWPLIKAH